MMGERQNNETVVAQLRYDHCSVQLATGDQAQRNRLMIGCTQVESIIICIAENIDYMYI